MKAICYMTVRIAGLLILWHAFLYLSSPLLHAQALKNGADVSPDSIRTFLVLTEKQEKYPLGRYLEYFEDQTGKLTIDDVSSSTYHTQFIESEKDVATIGLTESTYWVRVHLRNENKAQSEWRLIIQQPYLDIVDLYSPGINGQFRVKKAGDLRPFDMREVEHRKSVFVVTIPYQSEQTLYLRLQSTGVMVFDLQLLTTDAFLLDALWQQLFLGLFLGALCIMGAYNFFLFLALGDRAYLNYVLFLLCITIHLSTMEYGLTYKYLWPDWVIFNHMATTLFILLSMVFALNFVMLFLQTKKYAPKLHRCMQVLRFPYLLLAVLSVLQQNNWLIVSGAGLLLPSTIIVMIAGILAWRNGFQPARYYILAWSMIWLNGIAFSLHLLGLAHIPSHIQFVPFTVTGMMLFLSLALADRINVLKKNTEQAKAETDGINIQLKKHQKQLTRSEKKYRTIFEDSNDMIFVTKLNGQVEDVSPACESVLGYSRSEFLTLNTEKTYVKASDRKHLHKRMLQYGGIKDYEVKLRRKNGKIIDTMITGTLRHDDHGTVVGYQGIVRNISAQKKAEAERLKALEMKTEKELAEAANRAKSIFLANMSHELRTPLNAILGFSELMTRDQNLTAEQQKNLETIGRSGEHLLALINDVLEFSKIEAGNVELRPENFDLHRMLLTLEEMFRIRTEEKNLALKVVIGKDVPGFIRADKNKMRQVLINLLANAVQYTLKGGVTLRVENDMQREKQEISGPQSSRKVPLSFEVDDTGKGIATNDLQSVFQAFFRSTAENAVSQGTGLGLSISQKFVRMMDGELKVSSRMGYGTKFHFNLMVELADNSEIDSDNSGSRVIGLKPGQQNFKILVVEDDYNSRNLLVKLLQQVGFNAREASDGREAIAVFEKWRPDLIWMDIRMPVMDGFETTMRIKERTDAMETVIIALTASAFEEDRAKVLEHGCDDFVRKPFKENDIFEKMHKFLGVQYLYRTMTPTANQPDDEHGKELNPTMLLELPVKLRLELQNAVEVVDYERTLDAIKKIPTKDRAIAVVLTDLVNQYKFDKLQKLMS